MYLPCPSKKHGAAETGKREGPGMFAAGGYKDMQVNAQNIFQCDSASTRAPELCKHNMAVDPNRHEGCCAVNFVPHRSHSSSASTSLTSVCGCNGKQCCGVDLQVPNLHLHTCSCGSATHLSTGRPPSCAELRLGLSWTAGSKKTAVHCCALLSSEGASTHFRS